MKNWTKEEDDVLINNRLSGMSPTDIHQILPYRTKGALCARLNVLRKRFDLVFPHGNLKWKDEELLDAVIKYRTTENLNKNKEAHEPWAAIVCARFGGWGKALKAAGMKPNTHVLDTDKPTILYLVYLRDCDLYKIGITQNIDTRFNRFSDAVLLDTYKSTLKDCRLIERELLNVLKSYKATDFPDYLIANGGSECFEGIKVEKLEDIYNLSLD